MHNVYGSMLRKMCAVFTHRLAIKYAALPSMMNTWSTYQCRNSLAKQRKLMISKIIIAVLVIQLDLIFWGLCCFTVLGILKLYSRQSWHACIQQLNKKKTALLLLSAELLHFPLSFVLLFLYQSIFRSIEFCFVISLLCLLFVSIRFLQYCTI